MNVPMNILHLTTSDPPKDDHLSPKRLQVTLRVFHTREKVDLGYDIVRQYGLFHDSLREQFKVISRGYVQRTLSNGASSMAVHVPP